MATAIIAIIILWFLHRLENDGRLKWGELVVFILSDTFYQGYSQCTTIFILDLYWTTEYLTFYSAFKLISNFFIVERPLRCYFYRSLCKTIVIVFPHCLGQACRYRIQFVSRYRYRYAITIGIGIAIQFWKRYTIHVPNRLHVLKLAAVLCGECC